MKVEFENEEIKRLATDVKYFGKWSPAIIYKYRWVLNLIDQMKDRMSFWNWKGLKFRHYEGHEGVYTVRLNKKWGIFLKIEERDGEDIILILSINDPHQKRVKRYGR